MNDTCALSLSLHCRYAVTTGKNEVTLQQQSVNKNVTLNLQPQSWHRMLHGGSLLGAVEIHGASLQTAETGFTTTPYTVVSLFGTCMIAM